MVHNYNSQATKFALERFAKECVANDLCPHEVQNIDEIAITSIHIENNLKDRFIIKHKGCDEIIGVYFYDVIKNGLSGLVEYYLTDKKMYKTGEYELLSKEQIHPLINNTSQLMDNDVLNYIIDRCSSDESKEIDNFIHRCLQENNVQSIDHSLGNITDNREKQQIEFRYNASLLGTLQYDLIYGSIKQFYKVNIIRGRELNMTEIKTKQKSDGGSSSYYWVEIPLDRVVVDEEKGTVGFMLEEYIKHGLGNDFDRGNLAKANHRVGKKSGNDVSYDCNKMHYYVDQIKKNS